MWCVLCVVCFLQQRVTVFLAAINFQWRYDEMSIKMKSLLIKIGQHGCDPRSWKIRGGRSACALRVHSRTNCGAFALLSETPIIEKIVEAQFSQEPIVEVLKVFPHVWDSEAWSRLWPSQCHRTMGNHYSGLNEGYREAECGHPSATDHGEHRGGDPAGVPDRRLRSTLCPSQCHRSWRLFVEMTTKALVMSDKISNEIILLSKVGQCGSGTTRS